MDFRLIDEERYVRQMGERVLPALEACRVEGWMEPAQEPGLPPVDGRLHYVCYDAAKFDDLREEGATGVFHGAIVISHGFTEFAAKYAEMIWYFLLAGYSVCMMEHRGHGYSARDVDEDHVVYIDDWRRYVADLAAFAGTVGRTYADGQPMHLYCHSMGGGIGAAVLEQHPTLFDKAVLSSPMIAPATGVPNWLAAAAAEVLCACGLGRRAVFGQGPMDPEFRPEEHEGASLARVRWYHDQRLADPHHRTNAAAFSWVRQALRLSRAVQRPSACDRIETPILLFQSGRDVWVLNEPQDRFVTRVRDGGDDIERVRYDAAVHEIFSMPNATLGDYLGRILDFYGSPQLVIA